jgi:hypothetical protein
LDESKSPWLQQIPKFLKDAPSFIIFGALHFGAVEGEGNDGIRKRLESEGYEVKPVQ